MELPFRIGSGYDSHRFVPGRRLVLCGQVIEHSAGLLGHSDADAPVHALIDAILGALAMGDIGRLFPDSDPSFKDAESMALLRNVMSRIRDWQIGNADLTIITEMPKLAPFMDAMRQIWQMLCKQIFKIFPSKPKRQKNSVPSGQGRRSKLMPLFLW